jgi:hypothetical protein
LRVRPSVRFASASSKTGREAWSNKSVVIPTTPSSFSSASANPCRAAAFASSVAVAAASRTTTMRSNIGMHVSSRNSAMMLDLLCFVTADRRERIASDSGFNITEIRGFLVAMDYSSDWDNVQHISKSASLQQMCITYVNGH